jgi:hypothetical protein
LPDGMKRQPGTGAPVVNNEQLLQLLDFLGWIVQDREELERGDEALTKRSDNRKESSYFYWTESWRGQERKRMQSDVLANSTEKAALLEKKKNSHRLNVIVMHVSLNRTPVIGTLKWHYFLRRAVEIYTSSFCHLT